MIDFSSRARLTTALLALFGASMMLGCGRAQEPPLPPPLPPPVVTVTHPAPPPPPQRTVVPTTEEWIRLPASILYPTGGSRLDDQARAMIREGHASMVHRTDIIRIRVEGHTDSRGNPEANRRLSLERAQGVVDFMVGELGMPRELFEVQSFGHDVRRTSEATAADRLQNRRVEFSILVRRQAAH